MNEPERIGVDQLIADVQALLESSQTGRLVEYLSSLRLQPESLAPYLRFNKAHYTRNLVFKNDLFEMLVLCWDIGHSSWIHNHRGQHCWMAVLEGTLAVRNYKRLKCDQQLRTVSLKPMPELLVSAGDTVAVDPAEPVHLVWNPAELNRPAVGLHIYSLPFDSCVAYDAERGLCRDVTMFYTSEYGRSIDRQPGEGRLADIPPCLCTLSSKEQDAHCGTIPEALENKE